MEVGGEAYHSTVSSASLQKSTQKPMMHDREAYNGGFWYASLLGRLPNDMEVGGEAYHSTVSSASLQEKAMSPAVSHSEAHHGGF